MLGLFAEEDSLVFSKICSSDLPDLQLEAVVCLEEQREARLAGVDLPVSAAAVVDGGGHWGREGVPVTTTGLCGRD